MKAQSDRGMIKWAPFQSLKEQAVYLKRMRDERHKIEKPIILQDKIEEINEVLSSYHGEEVCIQFYQCGLIKFERGEITRMDPYQNRIHINEKDIPLKDVLDIEVL